MATNKTLPTTWKPGTVKGTARVTTTQLVPGMTMRFPGNKRAGRDARTALITAVRSELRSNGNSKRARWYLVDFSDGSGCTLAPASRHDVAAGPDGAPLVQTADVEPTPAPEQGRTVAATESGPVLQLRLVEYPGTLF
jgi:hypothetical protein